MLQNISAVRENSVHEALLVGFQTVLEGVLAILRYQPAALQDERGRTGLGGFDRDRAAEDMTLFCSPIYIFYISIQ